jgi:nucleoside diphosphate kinase
VPSSSFVSKLAPDPRTRDFFHTDTNFLEAADRIIAITGSEGAAQKWAWDHALFVVQPDTFARRHAGAVVDHIGKAGFDPVASRVIQMKELQLRELWWYQLNHLTTDFKDIFDLYMNIHPSLAVVARQDVGNTRRLPAAVRLTDVKGASNPANRHPDSLRAQFDILNVLLAYMHASDGPAEMLRELHVLWGTDGFTELVQSTLDPKRLVRGKTDVERGKADVEANVARLTRHIPENPINFQESVDRVISGVQKTNSPHRHDIVLTCERIRVARDDRENSAYTVDDKVDLWHQLQDGVRRLGFRPDGIDPLDFAVIGSEIVPEIEPGREPAIKPWKVPQWQESGLTLT